MEQSDLPFARFAELLAASPELLHIELQGEGESLLHPQFFAMVQLARSRNIKVSLISNGSLLSPAAIEQILDLGIEKISVSLESADAETFRQIRGGKLERVVRGLSDLLAARQARKLTRPLVAFSITVLKQTQDQLGGILALYRQLGLDGGITLQPLQTMPGYVQNYPDSMRQQLLSDSEVSDLWIQFYADREIKRIQRDRRRRPGSGFFDELLADFRPGARRCPWLERGLYVNNKGEATACCMVKDTARFGFGRYGSDSMAAILAKRQAMQDELRSGVLPAACSGCELGRFAVMSRWQLVRFALRGLLRRWSPRRWWRLGSTAKRRPPSRSLPLVSQ
jgi:MoaA/NifB/PqqE/SkfB family radical SAM enzyme